MRVSRPQGSSSTKPAWATCTADRTCSWLPPGVPSRTFSRTDAENSVGSSKATATLDRNSARSNSLMSTPSSAIDPSVTSYIRFTRLVSVVLPEPVAPTRASVSPGFSSRSMPRSRSSLLGAASAKWKRTPENVRRPRDCGAAVGSVGEVTVTGESITSKNRSDAEAVSLASAISQPIESMGQRSVIATPKNATNVPAVSVPAATSRMPSNSVRPSAISGSAMITAQSSETTLALVSSVVRSPPASLRNSRPRWALRPNAFRMRIPSTDSSTLVARSPTWSCARRASTR